MKKHEVKRTPITHHYKHIVVCFGDIIGFTHWSKSQFYSQSNFHKKILGIYNEFLKFQHDDSLFIKLMGDGFMFVLEIGNNREENKKRIVSIVKSVKTFVDKINLNIETMDFPKPKGFRARIAAGEVLKFEMMIAGKKQVDYIGYPVNFAFNLLSVQPQIAFMAHESIRSMLDLKSEDSIRAIPIHIKEQFYKGIDKEDLLSLWDFEFV